MEQAQPEKKLPVPNQLNITRQVCSAICETIGSRRAETGGILGGNRETGEVTHFFFDDAPRENTRALYVPNNSLLNDVRKTQWQPQGIDYLGSIHSHPPYILHPSAGDEAYAKRILEVLEVPYILVPIVTTLPDTGSFSLHPFVAALYGNNLRIIEQDLVIGGNLIRPSQSPEQHTTEDTEESITALMELTMTAMIYGSMPWMNMPTMPKRRGGYNRRRRFDNDYD